MSETGDAEHNPTPFDQLLAEANFHDENNQQLLRIVLSEAVEHTRILERINNHTYVTPLHGDGNEHDQRLFSLGVLQTCYIFLNEVAEVEGGWEARVFDVVLTKND